MLTIMMSRLARRFGLGVVLGGAVRAAAREGLVQAVAGQPRAAQGARQVVNRAADAGGVIGFVAHVSWGK